MFKSGCDFILPFNFNEKKISEKQFIRLLKKGSTVNLKGFKTDIEIRKTIPKNSSQIN